MERNIRLLIAFDGTHYSGWQRQENAPTIQGAVENSLSVITGAKVRLHGAGRTDAGVHAAGMVANFMTRSAVPCRGFLKGLNSMLDPAIRVLAAEEAEEQFHSRRSATGKTYRYTVFTGTIQSPMERLYTAHYSMRPDEEAVRRALGHILGTHDFSSFEGSGSRDGSRATGRGAVRTLFRTEFMPEHGRSGVWFFRFTGDGFLRHMVRNLVGTLLLVGNSKMSSDAFLTLLHSHNRCLAGPTAPARGLVLEQVHYEPLTRS